MTELDLNWFNDTVQKKVVETKRKNRRPRFLILDRETFLNLKAVLDSYLVMARQQRDVSKGDSFMGLVIAEVNTDLTIIEVRA